VEGLRKLDAEGQLSQAFGKIRAVKLCVVEQIANPTDGVALPRSERILVLFVVRHVTLSGKCFSRDEEYMAA
jgi:hypothetical protein